MDNDYLYILGALALIAVFFIFFIYFKSIDSVEIKYDGLQNSKIEQHMETDHQVECDGDKCFIKHKETSKPVNKSANCDGEKCI